MKLKKSIIHLSSLISYKLLFILLLSISFPRISAQTKDNLNIFYSLIDSSVIQITKSIPKDNKDIIIKMNLNDGYSIFENKILAAFNNNFNNVSINDSSNKFLINYSIDNAKVTYPNVFRENIFGSWEVQRNVLLSGNYSVTLNGIIKVSEPFSFNNPDTIYYDQIDKLESQNFSFTRGDKPAEPFFSSILEPVLALGTAATIIYLFFTIRSK